MRCPSCNKMASQEPGEVEISLDDPSYEDKVVTVTGTAAIKLTSACCGDEIKEATFDIDQSIPVPEQTCDCTDFSADYNGEEITDRRNTYEEVTVKRGPDAGKVVRKPIPARYQKQFYGVSVNIEVTCSCGATHGDATFTDEIQSSSMEELA